MGKLDKYIHKIKCLYYKRWKYKINNLNFNIQKSENIEDWIQNKQKQKKKKNQNRNQLNCKQKINRENQWMELNQKLVKEKWNRIHKSTKLKPR